MTTSESNDCTAATTTTTTTRGRSNSFATIDEVEASGILTDILLEHEVYLGGSSIGKGFKSAARYYMRNSLLENQQQQDTTTTTTTQLFWKQNTQDLSPNVLKKSILEDAFYVVDLGIIVSQVYQWRKFLPRIEPFYAVKCNPDPVILKTLAIMGCHFDCASRQEMALVQDVCRDLLPSTRKPDIIYANPTKARAHIVEAVCRGVVLMTFDNVSEVVKCAQISTKIQLVLRIVTDDRGSQCRLSSKFGAPRPRWRNLLRAAKLHGLQVVGVSFHVGSGCRDASRYESALRDARDVFDMARNEFGMTMTLLDIGGGFPGETHSVWNPADLDFFREDDEEAQSKKEGLEPDGSEFPSSYMFFQEIAVAVAPIIDELFPSPSVRVIGEPGRYFVAAAATLCACIVSTRSNEVDEKTFDPDPISDSVASKYVDSMTRQDEQDHVQSQAVSRGGDEDEVLDTIVEELNDYSKLFAKQTLVQQEADVYNDALDLYKWDIDTAADLLGMPDEVQMKHQVHTVEGMTKNLVDQSTAEGDHPDGLVTLAAAGEAAINGIVMQAVADSAPLQDDFAYYINDGVYGAFNNIMFDHASVRPRVLKKIHKSLGDCSSADGGDNNKYATKDGTTGFITLLEAPQSDSEPDEEEDKLLFASTVFGPTCDSIDVIARSVLLPKLKVGDWLYFQNMGAYTMAAASSFNGFEPTEKMYVCSVQPEFFESLIAGPSEEQMPNTLGADGGGMPIGFVPSSTGVEPMSVMTTTKTAAVDKVIQKEGGEGNVEEKKEEC